MIKKAALRVIALISIIIGVGFSVGAYGKLSDPYPGGEGLAIAYIFGAITAFYLSHILFVGKLDSPFLWICPAFLMAYFTAFLIWTCLFTISFWEIEMGPPVPWIFYGIAFMGTIPFAATVFLGYKGYKAFKRHKGG